MERFRLQSVNVDQVKDLIRKQPGVTYLEDSVTNIQGIKIWGTPWFSFISLFLKKNPQENHSLTHSFSSKRQPEFGGWGFNLQRGEPCIEVFLFFFFLKQKPEMK